MSETVVTIEKLVFGGSGLARTEQGVVFVSDVAPGETVAIKRCGKKGGVACGRPVEILKASPARRDPPCPLAGTCGGCDWLHIIYKEQLAIKKEIFLECMRRIGRIENLPAPETIASGEFGYRHRARMKIDVQGNAGFFARSTNRVVPVQNCPLLTGPLNTLLTSLSERNLVFPGQVKNLMLVSGDDGSVASHPVIDGHTSKSVTITAGARTFEVPANGFFQSNRPLLERLGSWARAYTGGGRCIDLYGGSGFFSVMLADQFRQGLLIESADINAAGARINFKRNRIEHFTAVKGTAEQLRELAGAEPIDCLIVDPPRSGLDGKVHTAIAALKPRTVLYVSCNPPTQARDAGFLMKNAGYTVQHAALFDLYPNTHHIESILLLTHPS